MNPKRVSRQPSSRRIRSKNDELATLTLQNWLLIMSCVMIFLLLPLLFIWNSLGMIHAGVYAKYTPSVIPQEKSVHSQNQLPTDASPKGTVYGKIAG